MKTPSTKLVYFSPTGTTKTVVEAVARGFEATAIERIDLTKPMTRLKPLQTEKDELLIVGMPVYMGRLPEVIGEWLQSIKADNTPTVCLLFMVIVSMMTPSVNSKTYSSLMDVPRLLLALLLASIPFPAIKHQSPTADLTTMISARRKHLAA